jgi:hypothetical protein
MLAERHRAVERFHAHPHLVAVLDAVVDVESVDRGSHQSTQDGAAFCLFAIHGVEIVTAAAEQT